MASPHNPYPRFYVHGDHGVITVGLRSNIPICYDDDDIVQPGYSEYGIFMFDVCEYEKRTGHSISDGQLIDILDIGYWYRKDGYRQYQSYDKQRWVRLHPSK